MVTIFQKIIFGIGTSVILISLVYALLIFKSVSKKHPMKYFCVSPIIALILSINTLLYFYNCYNQKAYFLFQYGLFFMDAVFWGYFFSKIFKISSDQRMVQLLFLVAFSINAILISSSIYSVPSFHLQAIFNLFKTLSCLFYYLRLFKNESKFNLTKEPIFWVTNGVFFYNGLSLPFYTLNSYFKNAMPLDLYHNIFSITNILIITMHLFFIKGNSLLLSPDTKKQPL